VTITVEGNPHAYEALNSYGDITGFRMDMEKATEGDIEIEGFQGRDRLMEMATRTVYSNTVAALNGIANARPVLALVLWRLYEGLRWSSMDSTVYCLNRLRELAPTTFEIARLLFLSQWDPDSREEFKSPPGSGRVAYAVTEMLKREKNGQRKEATELLNKLSAVRRHGGTLAGPEKAVMTSEEDS
jgi:hypothetical protein